jgi:salicylate hydroxylase
MAIEDGAVLARCLSDARPIEESFGAYEAARMERTSRIVRGSSENARRFHNPRLGSVEGAIDYVNTEWAEERVRERYHWLFDYKFDEAKVSA